MDDRIAIQEAAAAGISSMERLVTQISSHSQIDCMEITDFTVGKFKKVISLLDRSGHARFRRGPVVSSSLPPPKLTLNVATPTTQALTLDFVKPEESAKPNNNNNNNIGLYISSGPMSSANSSFLSSLTGDGSVSNGKHGSSSLLLTPTPAVAAASAAPTLSAGGKQAGPSKKTVRCQNHEHSSDVSGKLGRCHCSKRSRKSRVKRTIRVPAVSSKMADIPPDEYSWRKYGQKPIKGSPYPRGYYKCSTVRGCPARKHVERATDDPTMLIVTYENEHRHNPTTHSASVIETARPGGRLVFGSV